MLPNFYQTQLLEAGCDEADVVVLPALYLPLQ